MAVANTYTLALTDLGLYGKTLTANSEDQITVARSHAFDVVALALLSDGTAAMYFTTDGTAPTVGGANTRELPAGAIAQLTFSLPLNQTTVRLISAGTPKYSLTREG
jgi:hypothetical protein